MSSRFTALLVWSLVGALAVFWGLRLFGGPSLAPKAAAVGWTAPVPTQGLSRLLGAPDVQTPEPVAPPASSRFQLLGVVAPVLVPGQTAVGRGAALIATDGKPPRAYSIGAALDDQWYVQSIGPRTVTLAPRAGGAGFDLQVPALPPPATGVLPPPEGLSAPVQPQPAVPPSQNMQVPPIPGSTMPDTRLNAS
jgi:general secretion pathway protein C